MMHVFSLNPFVRTKVPITENLFYLFHLNETSIQINLKVDASQAISYKKGKDM